jgi:asparagine synthase (glutamine-hydrolysing)
MCDAMMHRGPDDFGAHVDGHAAIAMRRLSIIDLATGRQPIANEDGTVWVVLNGEIYNYRQLRQDLEQRGHRFRTTSDTEVIVHAYEDFGEACVDRLRGMFAFAVWDSRRKVLLLARDRLGIKPLYYAELPGSLVFASELKALLEHPGIPRDLDPAALAEYLAHLCVPGDMSIFESVRKLPPAHVLTCAGGHVRLTRYWMVQPTPDDRRSDTDWTEELRECFRDAVESHLVADVPVGAFLSGGLDSGSMVAVMAQASPDPVRTFTVGFETPVGNFDERAPARAVAERYGTIHQECLLQADLSDLLPRIAQTFDEPFADSSAIPNWLVCQETGRHVKVALSGLGGDELFGGYERYVGLQLAEHYRRVPGALRSAIARIVAGQRDGRFGDRLQRFIGANELPRAAGYRRMIAAFADLDEILRPEVHRALDARTSRYDEVIDGVDIRHPLDVGLFSDLYLYLPDDLLTLTDRVSMAHSLEVRVPFLDHHLVELAARMPARLKVRGLQKKWLFRRAVAPWLPKGHLNRPKQGFSVPMAAWLRGTLRTLVSDLMASRELRESPWLNHAAIRKLVHEHLTGRANHEVRLWALIAFCEWQRRYHPAQSRIAA